MHSSSLILLRIQEYMKPYALDNAKKAGILTSERHNSLRLVRGIAESLPVGDHTVDADTWRMSPGASRKNMVILK